MSFIHPCAPSSTLCLICMQYVSFVCYTYLTGKQTEMSIHITQSCASDTKNNSTTVGFWQGDVERECKVQKNFFFPLTVLCIEIKMLLSLSQKALLWVEGLLQDLLIPFFSAFPPVCHCNSAHKVDLFLHCSMYC